MRYNKELKAKATAFAKEKGILAACKEFKLSNGTVSYWVQEDKKKQNNIKVIDASKNTQKMISISEYDIDLLLKNNKELTLENVTLKFKLSKFLEMAKLLLND